jgi:hypothetical protein
LCEKSFLSALNLTFSPRRRKSNDGFVFLRMVVRQIQSQVFSMRRRMILLLLGEKVGLRESVATSFPHNIFWTNFSGGLKVKIVKQNVTRPDRAKPAATPAQK